MVGSFSTTACKIADAASSKLASGLLDGLDEFAIDFRTASNISLSIFGGLVTVHFRISSCETDNSINDLTCLSSLIYEK